MEQLINYFTTYTVIDLVAVVSMVVACVIGFEKFLKWATEKLIALYHYKRGIERKEDTLETHTKEIQALTERIDSLVATLGNHYTSILGKVEEQQSHLEQIEAEGKKRDLALLRDRISGGMRYFSQTKDENGLVHISVSDHENMEDLFNEYFGAGGNGTFKQMYDNEFKKFIIDK